jgi:hypothetical protein
LRSKIGLCLVLPIIALVFCSLSPGEEYTADYWLEKANNYYNEGSFDISLLSINKSLEIDPTNIEGKLILCIEYV